MTLPLRKSTTRPVLRLLLPLLLPLAARWVARRERRVLALGEPLSPAEFADAVALGIARPEQVRVLAVERVPLPAIRLLELVARLAGRTPPQTIGLSARYGVFLLREHRHDRRLLAHELTHTLQYERLGGIRPFLRRYLEECLSVGYLNAPMEREARAAAERLCGE